MPDKRSSPRKKEGGEAAGAKRQQRLKDLLRARDELVEDLGRRVAEINREIEAVAETAPSRAAPPPASPPRSSPRSTLRAKVLDALDDIGWATYTRQLGPYLEARHGERVAPSRFGVLAADEQAAFRNGRPRPVYIGFALTWDRGEPIKRLLTRSDWPLEQRIVAPTTGRVQHLRVLARLCEIADELGPRAADPDRLRFLIADHARDLPGVKVDRGRVELKRWRDLALEELQRFEERDGANRRQAAERLAGRSEWALLFGTPEVVEGDEQGRGSTKRAAR
jgi:hypothetical protein